MAACAHSTDWAINSHLYNFGHDDASMIDDETGLERNAYGIARLVRSKNSAWNQ